MGDEGRQTIRYTDDIANGAVTMECEIDVVIDWTRILYAMGPRACRSKSGRCKDGAITVKRVGKPKEVSREIVEWT